MCDIELRQSLRAQMRQARHQAAENFTTLDQARLLQNFFDHIKPIPGHIIAGYYPYGHEIDVLPIMHELLARGFTLALPIIIAPHAPLQFRQWQIDTPMCLNIYKIPEPHTAAPLMVPDFVLAPLLAFDRKGGRLGTGGGYYDRTLAQLRQQQPTTLVGIGYSQQELPVVPMAEHDQRLNYVVTESTAHYCSPELLQ